MTHVGRGDAGLSSCHARPVWARYSVALACVALGWLARAALTPAMGPTAVPFIFFFPAVVIASWYGGLGAGLLATILSAAAANWAFIPPIHAWSVIESDEYHVMFFLVACGFILCAIEAMHRRTEQALRELTARQQAERQNLFEAQRARRLLEVGNHCSRLGDDFDQCLAEILDAAIEVTNADKGNVQIVDGKTGALVLAAHRGFEKPFLEFFASVCDGTAAVCSAAKESTQRIIVEDVVSSEIFANKQSLNVLLDAGVRAVQSTPLISSDGKIVGMISTHFKQAHQPGDHELRFIDLLARQAADYIERKQVEEILRAKEQQSETIINKTPFMLTRCSRDLHYRFVSRAYAKMIGRKSEEVAGKSIREIMGEEGFKTILPHVEKVLAGNRVEYETNVHFHGVGTRLLHVLYTPDMDEEGNVCGWLGSIMDITDRREAEQGRRDSDERFRALVSIMTDITWRTDAAGHYVTPQHSWEKFTGQSWEEHRGSGWVNAVHPDDRERVAELWRRACETRTPYESRGRLWHAPSQSWHYYVGRAVPLLNDDGTVREWVGCYADVHEQKIAESALRQSEQRFRTMANGAPVMIWVSGTDKLCTWFNQQWLQFTGRTMEQELGNGWAESVHKEDFDGCLKKYVESFDARQPFTMEYRLRRHDDQWRWVLDNGVPTYSGEDFTGYIGSCIDVTDRKKAEEALHLSEQRALAFLNNSAIVAWLKDEEGRNVFLSDNFVRRFGLKNWKNKTDLELWPPDIAKVFRQHDQLALGRDEPFECVEEVRTSDGQVSYWLNSKFWFRDPAGNKYVGGVGVDITARTQAEEALREALKAKDRFLASISHELRTPLTPVLIMTEMLQQNKTLPQPVKSALEVIARNVRLEAKLVNDLLDISRAISGKLHVELTECDLHEIVERAMRVCFGPSNAKQLSVVTKLNAPRRKFRGDATRLQQVFWNLMQNALKFTPSGGSVTISSRNENGRVCVDISDTGRGIEPAMLERIFEPFTEENSASNGNGSREGLGLGLSIARSIVAAHGGTLVATSDGADRGATFTVSIPILPGVTDLPLLQDNGSPKKTQALARTAKSQPNTSRTLSS